MHIIFRDCSTRKLSHNQIEDGLFSMLWERIDGGVESPRFIVEAAEMLTLLEPDLNPSSVEFRNYLHSYLLSHLPVQDRERLDPWGSEADITAF